MKHLFQQWRLVRYLDRRIKAERDSSKGKLGIEYRLYSQTVIDDYAAKRDISPAEATDLLGACIDNHYTGELTDGGGISRVWINNSDGQYFRPVITGLVNEILKKFGLLWSFLLGLSPTIIFIVLRLAKVIR